jgi:hypothetical protein
MYRLLKFSLLILVLFLFGSEFASAQCAMCRATIEANAANSDKYGVQLNSGILYLMCVPYIAASIIGYLWYKNAKAKNTLPKFR